MIYRLVLLTKCLVVLVFCPFFVIDLFDVAHKVFECFVFCVLSLFCDVCCCLRGVC